MKDLIKEIQELQKQITQKELELSIIKADITALDALIETKKAQLMEQMDAKSIETEDVDDLNATIFSRENIGYKDENAVLAYLKENYPQFVRTKVTEAIDKTPLKKQIKADCILADALDSMTEKTITRYVVVTTKENSEKMLEHINGK